MYTGSLNSNGPVVESVSPEHFMLCIQSCRILVDTILFAVETLFSSSAVKVIVSNTCIGEGGPSWPSLSCASDRAFDVLLEGDEFTLTISKVKDDGVSFGDSSSTGSLNGFWWSGDVLRVYCLCSPGPSSFFCRGAGTKSGSCSSSVASS